MIPKTLRINFIGSFDVGYVGESADEVHLARELKNLGHKVTKVPRDVWKAYVEGTPPNDDWVLPKQADINILCKWHHFDRRHIKALKTYGPVFYWTWDWMEWPNPPGWHLEIAKEADLHLTNELGDFHKMNGVRAYYFPFDVVDEKFSYGNNPHKEYEVVFFGSCIGQGQRMEWIPKINTHHKVTCFSWNYNDWKKLGVEAHPPVYGQEFNDTVAKSKVCLQFSTNDDLWGYWSNRVGKVLSAGGFLLARYSPGMEMFLRDGAEYFSSVKEANEKIDYYLNNIPARVAVQKRGRQIGRDYFTSKQRIKELTILIERYLEEAKNGRSLWRQSI